MTATFETRLPLPLRARGKVRDTYELPDGDLLMVATDRLSAFDVVLPTPIPEKGRVLTQLSLYWFAHTGALVRNHVAQDQRIPAELIAVQPDLAARSMRVRTAEPIPFECVVRGYLSGSGWKEYQAGGTIGGDRLPPGLRESDRLPEPLFTPATKAQTGHDENISRAELSRRAGTELAEELERLSLALYRFGAAHALERGLIVADTKFEFGLLDGHIILIDEVLTPDSSRFWEASAYQPGGAQPSFDKQYVRDYLERIGWNKQPPGPSLPDDVVAGTRSRYLEAWHRLAGNLVSR
ncbi:MAG TPA: phosphoribosylaminoimidazolesuccinocarboxamide synthase [Candidatus Limnocylindrales bacterium]|nr:phosphoribosylaminoimidazolesuccinocarboxamide synthase [Candidatus Limnocylindrales bacterium]